MCWQRTLQLKGTKIIQQLLKINPPNRPRFLFCNSHQTIGLKLTLSHVKCEQVLEALSARITRAQSGNKSLVLCHIPGNLQDQDLATTPFCMIKEDQIGQSQKYPKLPGSTTEEPSSVEDELQQSSGDKEMGSLAGLYGRDESQKMIAEAQQKILIIGTTSPVNSMESDELESVLDELSEVV
ncbi:hypothetical protein BTVI_115497 [Pitangus sulphuratus]|nr:hypothetical protein BTVI_115497 [Pitangus sulphuratus]